MRSGRSFAEFIRRNSLLVGSAFSVSLVIVAATAAGYEYYSNPKLFVTSYIDYLESPIFEKKVKSPVDSKDNDPIN